MKKVYLSFLLAGFAATASYAQHNTKPITFGELPNEASIKPTQTQNQSKALGVTIFEDLFDNGNNWVIDNDGQPGGAFGWTIDAVNDGWWSTAGIQSTSGGGFAELSNGDASASTQALDVTYTMTSNAINIDSLTADALGTASNLVTLEFEQYGALFNDEQTIQISTDGGNTWEIMRDNRDHYEVLSASGGDPYPNFDLITIPLGPYLTGAYTDVRIRFQWTTAFPQFSTNSAVWITYGWYIDDLRINTNPDYDAAAVEPYWGTAGLNYSRIPTTQVAPIDFATFVSNDGSNTLTDVTLNVDVNSGGWTGTSTPVDIPVLTVDSIGTSTQYTPAAVVGSHSFTWEITQNEVDDVPSNNTITGDAFDVTQYDYAMDDDVIDGSTGNGGFGFEKGNFYDIWADQTAYAIQTKIASNAEVGSIVYGKIYRWDPTNATTFADALFYEQQTDFYEITQSDLSGGLLTLPLLAPHNLTAASNTYFVVVVSDGDGGASDDVQIATSGVSPTGFSYFYAADDDAWYLQPQTPIVRLSFDPAFNIGLEELSNVSALNVFPNPASEEVKVSFNVTDASDVKVEVLDITGKAIETVVDAANVTGMQNNSVNITDYAAGVYVINITTNEGSIQRKFVKK
ncbi:MAG: T9SS type A sorting domain-containing protein [bacterium]|nr:T9SS type A sorting domain-containing protein [bacterium]